MFVRAYAKINLTLDVLGKRDDGYHELASVLQTVALHDTICLRPAAPGQITCACNVPELAGSDNLAVRAAELLRNDEDHGRHGVLIELRKKIPARAGLGGGSSDAAVMLVALNRLWDLGVTSERLMALAARLGSDVPFFVHGGTALIRGRGEFVSPLPDAEALWLVLANPRVDMATADVFRSMTDGDFSDDAATQAVASAVESGQLLPLTELRNGMETAAIHLRAEIGELREALVRAGAPVVRMSGSGATLYAPFRSLVDAERVYEQVVRLGAQAWLSHTVGRVATVATESSLAVGEHGVDVGRRPGT
jgi:4-diphosphocytidyl-2-C-methyl-D-erythritol kinase